MIKQVPHPATGAGAAGLALALGVAYELHPPAADGGRAPEVAARGTAGRGAAKRAARARRRRADVRR
ncbi:MULTISPECIES: hypothetical protein [unclassified Streptomyces]|uniref:hypothetical protein n=1 Tax=unclassified Streptomyces TaxID=2593676 RepID=UPI003D715011